MHPGRSSQSGRIPLYVSLVGVVLFTCLLWFGKLGQVTYAGLIGALLFTFVVLLFPQRIREVDFKSMKFTLIEEVRREVRDDVVDMYVEHEGLKGTPFALGDIKMAELGLDANHLTTAGGVMRYTAGVTKRERERLARIFANEKSPLKLAEAILDSSLDEKVFKWNGPEQPLDSEPVSAQDRKTRETPT